MDAELIAIGRVRRAVKDLSGQAQMRVLQYVVGGFYEAEQARQRADQDAAISSRLGQGLHPGNPFHPGNQQTNAKQTN